MQNTSMEMPRRRPLGVSIIAILEAIEGIFFLVLAILALVAVIAAANSAGATIVNGYTITGAVVSAVAGVLAGVFLVVGLLSLLFAWGLWTLKRWAFWVTVVISAIDLIVDILGWIQPQLGVAVQELVPNMVLSAFILVALFMPDVRAAFR